MLWEKLYLNQEHCLILSKQKSTLEKNQLVLKSNWVLETKKVYVRDQRASLEFMERIISFKTAGADGSWKKWKLAARLGMSAG